MRNMFVGNRRVNQDVKKMDEQVFSLVSNKYDLMSDLMSFGLYRHWKNISEENIISPESFLRIMKEREGFFKHYYFRCIRRNRRCFFWNFDKLKRENIEILPNNVIVNFNSEMIEQGELKSIEKEDSSIVWLRDDGVQLSQVPSNSVDIFAISFGIRDFTNIEKILESF